MSHIVTQDVRELHERLGKVASQPVDVSSFTNKRLTINYRTPLDRLRQLIPSPIDVDEIPGTGMGMISMCVCDFWVSQFAGIPVPKTHTNEMLLRISVRVPKDGRFYRAYYTLRSDSSSRLLGFLGGHFSHFRKAISEFSMHESAEVYELHCTARDKLCGGDFKADLRSLDKETPNTTCFRNIQEATDFVFRLDGSCGYDFVGNRLSFQKIDYPEWNLSFCHEFTARFPLLDYLFMRYDLRPEFDCALFMEKVPQVWRSAWLYRPKHSAVSLES